jgi:putative PEP-CTERM system histidine kinase
MNSTDFLAWACAAFCGVMTFVVSWYGRRSPAHWAFAAGMLVLAAESLVIGFATDSVTSSELRGWQNWGMVATSFLPGTWLFFSVSYARGNFREFLGLWKVPLALAFVLPISIAIIFHDDLIVSIGKNESNQLMYVLGYPGIILNLLFLVSVILVLVNLERTYRAAVGTMRWRIKFMILGVGVIFAVRAYISIQTMLYHAINSSLQTVSLVALALGCALIVCSLFREGNFDMDVYPSHSALHNSFTVILAGVYLLMVGVFAKLVTFWGGDSAFALKAFIMLVAVVVLTVLLLSNRVRLHTRMFVSRHFQRPLYDYRSVWRKFTEGTASCVKQSELCQAATRLVADIFQVLSVSLWLVDDKKEGLRFATSTFLSEPKANELAPKDHEAPDIIRSLEEHPEPVDIDASKANWADILRRCHPDEFRKGGNRVCVPMVAGGELLGFMILGDRVGGVPYSWQDFDLLKCVGDEIAAGLLNLQLSQKLLQAKQLEAFQTMSTFFVHDLKNTTSTLNLMLNNLPVHYDDPAFREDTLRGIGKTVTHINQLISRLSMLRHELEIKPVESDLNEVAAQALSGLETATGIQLVKNFRPLPKVALDREQMLKVFTNLVLNAREAISSDGEIRIETDQNNGWAVLSVSDNGCGMNPEFLNRSLFQPFQTTKKNGLGIGLYQSKMIVEAHKGRIQVESQPGKGTTFRIILPISKQKE